MGPINPAENVSEEYRWEWVGYGVHSPTVQCQEKGIHQMGLKCWDMDYKTDLFLGY